MKCLIVTFMVLAAGLFSVSGQVKDLVILGDDVENIEMLKSAMIRETTIMTANAESDLFYEIFRHLEAEPGINQVHFLIPSQNCKLNINGKEYDAKTVSSIIDLELIRNKDLTLLFYASELASETHGKDLLNEIARLANINVAASTTKTAGLNVGGDWIMEFKTDNDLIINSLFDEQKLHGYPDSL